MRYESFPKKIINSCKSVFNYMKDEFGNWAYAFIAIIAIALYKPFLRLLDTASTLILYGFFGIIILAISYWLYRKVF